MMQLRGLDRFNPGAPIFLTIVLFALLAEGANDAARSALLSGALLAQLALAVMLASGRRLRGLLRANWISGAAGLALLAWAAVSAWPGGRFGALAHPDFAAFGLEQSAISLSPSRSLEGAVALLGPIAAYALGVLCGAGRSGRDSVGRWLAVLAIVYAMVALAMFMASQATLGGRLDVGIGSANAAATVFGLFALFALAMIVRAGAGKLDEGRASALPARLRWARFALRAPLSFTALIIVTACILLTASRGGLVAIVTAVLIFAAALAARTLTREVRAGAFLLPFAALGAIALAFFFRGGALLRERFSSLDGESRRLLMAEHWQAFLDRPLLGHGLNTFHEISARGSDPETWAQVRTAGSTHNIFIQGLEETGLIGACLFALMLGPPIVRALSRTLWGRSGAEWAAAAVAACVLCALHGVVDFGLQVPAISALFAFALGAFAGGGDSDPERARE